MSIGYCGKAHLIAEDKTMLIYSYTCYNLNLDNWREMKKKEDGIIYVHRDAFIEPEIHEKLKKMPSGRKKLVIKRILKAIPFRDLFDSKKISVTNASGIWETTKDGIDVMAIRLIGKIINEYQITGIIPKETDWAS